MVSAFLGLRFFPRIQEWVWVWLGAWGLPRDNFSHHPSREDGALGSGICGITFNGFSSWHSIWMTNDVY